TVVESASTRTGAGAGVATAKLGRSATRVGVTIGGIGVGSGSRTRVVADTFGAGAGVSDLTWTVTWLTAASLAALYAARRSCRVAWLPSATGVVSGAVGAPAASSPGARDADLRTS